MRSVRGAIPAAAVLAIVFMGAAPRATYDPSICQIQACGSATFDRFAAAAGQVVTITVDNGYFGFWTAAEWASWCDLLEASIQVYGKMPGEDVLAPLTITSADTATFIVPVAPPGTYGTGLSCSGDGGFAQPAMPRAFTVLARATDTATAETPSSETPDQRLWWAILAAGLISGLAVLLGRRAGARGPGPTAPSPPP